MWLEPTELCCQEGAIADPVNEPANCTVPKEEDVAGGTAVDALTDKTEPVIDKPDPSIISVTAEGS